MCHNIDIHHVTIVRTENVICIGCGATDKKSTINLAFSTWKNRTDLLTSIKSLIHKCIPFNDILIPIWNMCVSFCTECTIVSWTNVGNGALNVRSLEVINVLCKQYGYNSNNNNIFILRRLHIKMLYSQNHKCLIFNMAFWKGQTFPDQTPTIMRSAWPWPVVPFWF